MNPENVYTAKRRLRWGRWPLVLGFFAALMSGGNLMAQTAEEGPQMIEVSRSFWNSLTIEFIMVGVIFFLVFLIFLMLTVNPDKLNFNVALGDITGSTAKDPQMDHEYDGIIELDNPVPAWLRMILWGSVVFGVVYIFHYHILGTGQNQTEEYNAEIAQAEMLYKNVELPDDAIKLVSDESQIAQAKTIFLENCAACHGSLGEGKDGPNLTDEYWLHGGGVKNIYSTITNGVPAKGMISWKKLITSKERLALASYIMSLEGSNPPNGREPQGQKWTEGEGSTDAATTEEGADDPETDVADPASEDEGSEDAEPMEEVEIEESIDENTAE